MSRFLIKILILAGGFWFIQTGVAQSDEGVHLVSPIGAVGRSVIPGWGQFYAHNRLPGAVAFLGTSGLLIGAWMAHQSFQDIYNNDYVPIAIKDRNSPEAIFQYNRANQRFKLRQFFLLTAAGVWAYSMIDSYVSANLYNAKVKANRLIDDTKQIEDFGVQFGVTPTEFHLGLVKSF